MHILNMSFNLLNILILQVNLLLRQNKRTLPILIRLIILIQLLIDIPHIIINLSQFLFHTTSQAFLQSSNSRSIKLFQIWFNRIFRICIKQWSEFWKWYKLFLNQVKASQVFFLNKQAFRIKYCYYYSINKIIHI